MKRIHDHENLLEGLKLKRRGVPKSQINAKDSILSPGQLRDYLAWLRENEPMLYPIACLQGICGFRLLEAAYIREQDIDFSNGTVTVGWGLSGDRAELWVSDTGIGIDEKHRERVFDRFYRVDQARSRSRGGAGLGLSICRWIAEAHGGSISVESEQGSGSTFTVALPVHHS